MDSFKNKLLIILCVFVVITPFWLVKGFCVEVENVNFVPVYNLAMNPSYNYFFSGNHIICYVALEKGYIYHVQNTTETFQDYIAFSNDIAALNVPYYDFKSIGPGETFNFIADSYDYVYLNTMDRFHVTREKVPGFDSAVGDLVSNVGISQFWDTFDIGINYIVIAVVVALGLFIIFSLIRKLTKGKEGF